MGHLHHRVEQPKPDETAIADPSQLERGGSTKRSFIKPKSVSFICKSDMKEVDVCLCIASYNIMWIHRLIIVTTDYIFIGYNIIYLFNSQQREIPSS